VVAGLEVRVEVAAVALLERAEDEVAVEQRVVLPSSRRPYNPSARPRTSVPSPSSVAASASPRAPHADFE
jgi:hypothetical protein